MQVLSRGFLLFWDPVFFYLGFFAYFPFLFLTKMKTYFQIYPLKADRF